MRLIDADLLTEHINKGISKSNNELFIKVMELFRDEVVAQMPTVENVKAGGTDER